jgi:diacylglycerol kinase (CTP)
MVENILTHIHLKRRSDIHWARKIWHMTGVFSIFVLWSLLPPWLAYAGLLAATLIFLPLDIARQRHVALNDFLVHAFRPIMRSGEEKRLAGTSYLIAGVTFVAVVFPRDIVSITLLFLAFADPIASLVGIKYGKDKIFGHKSLQGFMAAYFVCFACSLVYMLSHAYPADRTLVFCILAGLVGALAELVPIWKLDDNLTLPVLSSIGLFGLFYFFGFL